VVRQPEDRALAIWQVWQTAQSLGWQYQGLTISPITGPAGNVEYLLWLKAATTSQVSALDLNQIQQIINLSSN
jgi:23S rRNA (cytidine1920-2'-O)/16S rRNA (cytidine1409-2'-O)-methyltransferase